jgi:hypothetical protein
VSTCSVATCQPGVPDVVDDDKVAAADVSLPGGRARRAFDAVVAIAEFARHAKRGRGCPRCAYRPPCVGPFEGQLPDRCPQLGADLLLLVVAAGQERAPRAAPRSRGCRWPEVPTTTLPRSAASSSIQPEGFQEPQWTRGFETCRGRVPRGRCRPPGDHQPLHLGVTHHGGGQVGQRGQVRPG